MAQRRLPDIVGPGWADALEPVAGWYQRRLTWGRRPLAEAGL